jgi:hypothetical protein
MEFDVTNQVLSDVLDAMLDPNLDHKAVVLKLAKQYPGTFLAVVEAVRTPDAMPWGRPIVEYIRNGKLVDAVRTLRTEQDLALKEALDVCVNVQWTMFGQGWIPEPQRECPPLANDLMVLANKLQAVAYRLYGA